MLKHLNIYKLIYKCKSKIINKKLKYKLKIYKYN